MRASLLSKAAALTAVAVATVHIATLAEHFKHQVYVGGLFVALVVGMAWTTLALWERHDDAVAWSIGTVGCFLAAMGFVFSRTFGIPSFNPAGAWNAIGITSLIVEGLLIVLFLARLAVIPSAGKLSWDAGLRGLSDNDGPALDDRRRVARGSGGRFDGGANRGTAEPVGRR